MTTFRLWYNLICGGFSAIAAVASLLFALRRSGTPNIQRREDIAQLIIGAWVLLPPIFFWLDWVLFCRGLPHEALESAKHTHELSRNIWLALVIALAAAFGLKWPPSA